MGEDNPGAEHGGEEHVTLPLLAAEALVDPENKDRFQFWSIVHCPTWQPRILQESPGRRTAPGRRSSALPWDTGVVHPKHF